MKKSNSLSHVSDTSRSICVVGAGRWGKNHIKTLYELGCLHGIVESRTDVRVEFQNKYQDVKTFPSIRYAIREDFDGFTVATPAEPILK